MLRARCFAPSVWMSAPVQLLSWPTRGTLLGSPPTQCRHRPSQPHPAPPTRCSESLRSRRSAVSHSCSCTFLPPSGASAPLLASELELHYYANVGRVSERLPTIILPKFLALS